VSDKVATSACVLCRIWLPMCECSVQLSWSAAGASAGLACRHLISTFCSGPLMIITDEALTGRNSLSLQQRRTAGALQSVSHQQ
jgi:hypothetical protein